jgi:hypothetical protein
MIESHTRECTRLKKDVNKKFIAKSLLFRFFFLAFLSGPGELQHNGSSSREEEKKINKRRYMFS